MSIKCITRPPSIFPSTLASFGSTASTISDRDALTAYPPVCSQLYPRPACLLFSVLFLAWKRFTCSATISARLARTAEPAIIRAFANGPKSEIAPRRSGTVCCQQTHGPVRTLRLALECVNLGDDQAAAEHFQKLLGLNPGYVAGYLQYGQFLSRVGRLDEARKILSDGVVVAQKAGDMHARDEIQAALNLLR